MEVEGKRVLLGPSNIVLRGCELKNIQWAVRVTVYTGSETKVMLNNSGAPSKRSRLEKHMNRETLLLSARLIAMCSIVAILAGIWSGNHKGDLDYYPYFRKRDFSSDDDKDYNYYGIGMEVFFGFLMSVIVFQVMILISLYISMEMVRLGQAYFMIQNSNLYHKNSNLKFRCRALNINEDLRQIKYVFLDKTRTLTENKMEFRCAMINHVDFSGAKDRLPGDMKVNTIIVDNVFWSPKMVVNTDPELSRLLRSGKEIAELSHARDFFLAFAACNIIVPLVVDTLDPQ